MDESTTDKVVVDTGGSDESLPVDNNTNTADEHRDADSGGETQSDADHSSSDDSQGQDDASSDTDEGLAKFAKSQGFDPASLSETERRALKIAHDSQKEFHKKRQEEAETLRNSVTELHDPTNVDDADLDDYVKEQREIRAEMAQLKQYQRVNEFWTQNPEAREYEQEMNKLVLDEKEKYGLESAIFLSRNLDRLYKLAKAEKSDPEAMKDAGRREEREQLRKKQEGSADSGSATQTGSRSSKIDQDWIENTYDPSNTEHRKMLDAYLTRG